MYYEACFCRANPMAYYMNKIEGHWMTLASPQKSPYLLFQLSYCSRRVSSFGFVSLLFISDQGTKPE